MRFDKREDGTCVLDGEGDLIINFRHGGVALYLGEEFLAEDRRHLLTNWHFVGINPWTVRGILSTLLIKLAIWIA